ncbi:MAG: efflux RND transporter periplasmic adaptor subunit, partial [Pseudomonadota bacterium]
EDDVAPGLRPVSVMVLESDAQETVAQLTIRGRTEANRHVNVAAETTGIVTSQPLRRGVEVEEGQVLCELSPGTREAQLQEARARVAQARADFAAADRLSERGFGAETTRMARSAELEAALAALDLVTWDIERLEITAPFSGFLESDTAEIGARLAPGDICANVIDLSVVKVTGFVGEQSVDQLTIGNTARARLINGMEVAGMISFISRMADEDTRTFLVEVTLDNQEGRLRDGMTAELLIDLPPFTAHRVPQSALTLDDEGRIGLRIASGATARFIPIRVIRDEADGVWIQGAGEQLPDRMQLIVVGQEFVRDGRAIQPVTISWDDLG